MTEPRIFIGTLYCGEGDYVECFNALASQKSVSVKHVVIENQPEKEAHNQLWAAWREVQHSGFDMFVKVDADTVLAHDEVLLELWKLMSSNPRITGIQATLLDYFTDGNINGLNCFSPKVTFRDTTSDLFCDRQVDVDHDIVLKAVDVNKITTRLRPSGFHCFRTTEKQAFHFGLHRALKGQHDVLDRVKNAFEIHGDRMRGVALLGADSAPVFRDGCFNYNDERFQQMFETVLKRYEDRITTL